MAEDKNEGRLPGWFMHALLLATTCIGAGYAFGMQSGGAEALIPRVERLERYNEALEKDISALKQTSASSNAKLDMVLEYMKAHK